MSRDSLRRTTACAAAAIAVATLMTFRPVLHYPFITYDDPGYVTANREVQKGLTAGSIAWAFTTRAMANWHPLTWLSHMLDVELFGLDAGGHHLMNVLLHTVSAVVLLGVLVRTTGALLPSALVAGLFALHPLHVESVVWVAERKDVLSTVFWMLTLVAYVTYVRRPGLGRYLLVCLMLALGLAAKPMLVTLPFVLLLLDAWPLGRVPAIASALGAPAGAPRQPPWSRLLWEKVPLLVLAAASCVATVVAQASVGALRSTAEVPLRSRAANALVVYVGYIGKMLWPVDLACPYPYRLDLVRWQIVAAAAALLLISAAVLSQLRRRPYLAVGWLWYLGTLVPVIGLVQVGPQAMADRYTYVPLIGLFIMLAWGTADLANRWGRRPAIWIVPAVAALGACALLTRTQLAYWKDSVTLFTHAIAVTRNNHLAHASLGMALAADGRRDEAAVHYREALRIAPNYAEAHNGLAGVLWEQGKFEWAAMHYGAAIQIRPDYIQARDNLGAALLRQGRVEEAGAQFEAVLKRDPKDAIAHNNLGLVRNKQGRVDEAIHHYLEALRLDPEYADAHYNLGNMRLAQGRTDEAIAHYREAVRIKPDAAEAHNNLGVALSRAGREDEAIAQYREAGLVNRDYPDSRVNLAAALRRRGEFDQAIGQFSEALAIAPDNADAHYGLANVLVEVGKIDEAIDHYRAALGARPGFADAHNNLGFVLARRGQFEEAIAEYSEALRIQPRLARAYANRAAAYAARGDASRADADLRRARELTGAPAGD